MQKTFITTLKVNFNFMQTTLTKKINLLSPGSTNAKTKKNSIF